MKKLIILLLALIPLLGIGQSLTPDTKNWNHKGRNDFNGLLYIGGLPFANTDITKLNNLVADNADTISLSEIDFEVVRVLNTLGVPTVMVPLTLEVGGGSGTFALGDGNIYYQLCLVKKTTILTSFNFVMSTAFVGTGDNYNGIAIMRQSNDTLYKISETVNNPDIWKAAATVPTTVDLPAPVTLVPGRYFIACIYNNSAQSTAPSMYGTNTNIWYNYVLPFSMKMSGYSSTSTNATIPSFVKQSAIYPTGNGYMVIGK